MSAENPIEPTDASNQAPTEQARADVPAPQTQASASEAGATPEASGESAPSEASEAPAKKKAGTKKAAATKTAAKKTTAKSAAKKSTAKKSAATKAAASDSASETATDTADPADTADTAGAADTGEQTQGTAEKSAPAAAFAAPLFQAPEPTAAPAKKKAAAADPVIPDLDDQLVQDDLAGTPEKPAAKKSAAKKSSKKKGSKGSKAVDSEAGDQPADGESAAQPTDTAVASASDEGAPNPADTANTVNTADATDAGDAGDTDSTDESGETGGSGRRRRRRGGRRRRKSGEGNDGNDSGDGNDSSDSGESGGSGAGGAQGADGADAETGGDSGSDDQNGDGEGGSGSRRRRRRRRAGDSSGESGSGDDPENTVTKVRKGSTAEDEITSLSGSTRLEAKKQRRREGREAGRRRAPIVSEAEFLARRESVDRVMVIRQREELTQIGVLEDDVLVEHYVARASQTSLIGNVYLGRVQNVLPSMEAAFIDIGKGRNAVLYAGEVNWKALGHKEGQPRKIESILSSGQTVLVQVTKDPIGHKGARLTSQISLAGRFLVYVPDGTTSGISRKLPDTERSRLKKLLKEIVPDSAGVIVRTAAEGASEDELTRDVERLKARWEDVEAKSTAGGAPKLLYGEPDLTLKVVRDLFTEDFAKLVIEGDQAWDTVQGYVSHVAPDLESRLERFEPAGEGKQAGKDVFAAYRIDEQIAKGLDRKVWLPSGGSLVIDRTEAMTVVDVNTGKFTGSGGNLEETVTRNNLEAAEEIVRQLRLRDIGGIVVVDFIDMVLESNRDLVLRRLVECLGRDRTRHQVAEVTSLGLVQMTRKRIGTGLLEAFSESCTHCNGRGLTTHDMPVESGRGGGNGGGSGGGNSGGNSNDDDGGSRRGRRGGRGRRGDGSDSPSNNNSNNGNGNGNNGPSGAGRVPSPKDVAAMAKPENADKAPVDDLPPLDASANDTASDSAPGSEQKKGAEKKQGTDQKQDAERTSGTQDQRTVAEAPPEPESKPRRSSRRRGAPAAATPEQPAGGSESTGTEPTGAVSTGSQSAGESRESAEPVVGVVTRTRRSASRRTGTSLTPAEVTVTTPAAAPVQAGQAGQGSESGTAAPEAPKVTVTTRARGSRRAQATQPGAGDTTAAGATGDTDSGADPS